MERDKLLIEEFIKGLNEYSGTSYRVTKQPDKLDRRNEAIDAIAYDNSGQILAVEHTLIQPFVGEKIDAQRLLTAIAPLEADHSLRIPGKALNVSIRVWAIPKGPDWKLVGAKAISWFREARLSIPDGQSMHHVPDVGFELTLQIKRSDSPYPEGRVYVMRSNMPEDFKSVIRKALEDKLPKLAGTPADRRILLFEMDNVPRSPTEITDAVEVLRDEFPSLNRINEIWCPLTAARDNEQEYIVMRVWPRSEAQWPHFTVSTR
jgi:hypothetical protein